MSHLPFAIQQKAMRLLVIATEKRHPAFFDVPTFREVGITGSTARTAHRGAC
jgi:tripartite-type tricarboxylate transporter receptor subunit TctC